jgi:predicted RNase H-like HicB family nuclease
MAAQAASNCSAYIASLPGCAATGPTEHNVVELLRQAIELHLAGMREDRVPIPEPSSDVEYLEVQAPAE